MTIRLGRFDMNCNVMSHPNVSVQSRFKNEDKTKFQTQNDLYDVIHPLLSARPTWRFVGIEVTRNNDKIVFTGFQVFEDGELLGSIKTHYTSRSSTYKLLIVNERIDAKRQRGSGYKTENAEKALLAVRKSFFRLGTAERVAKVNEQASQVINSEHGSKMFDLHRAKQGLLANSDGFVMARIDEYLSEFPELKQAHEKFTEQRDYFMVVDNVKSLLDKSEALIVVLDREHYIVVQGGVTHTYDSDSLPYHLKEKVGLLKLVNDHQMISDVGCRLSAEAFVVVPEQESKA